MHSLRTWLALGLAIAIVLPAGAGAVAWIAAGEWQLGRENARRAEALDLLGGASVDTPGLAERLTRLGVEAQLEPNVKRAFITGMDKQELAARQLRTPGLDAILEGPEGKLAISEAFTSASVDQPLITGRLWVRKEGAAARWVIALGTAGLGLAAALALAVAVLNRWVLRPLARLAGDADRIAGGELAVSPVETRAREVAQVRDALDGMAGALDTALGASAAAERDRRFLVSAIAHDLRTPLFTLRGSLEAIEHGIGNGDALARAQRKADHLDRLVGDLFVFARAEYARAGEDVDLGEIARRAAETVEPGDVGLVLSVPGPVPSHADPVALERVLTNLLDNAIRHACTRVEIAVAPGLVEVTDDGPGFSADDLPHVFEPLFRADTARGGGHAGLGLAIARRLARAHGGDVHAANTATGGARVTVTLP